ncbi:hypothetical protein ACB092_12G117200 [Castanea dentata]
MARLAANASPNSARLCQRHNVAIGASAAAIVQLKMQHNAAGNAAGQHQCASDQAEHSDNITANVKTIDVKIEELDDCLVTESSGPQLKKVKKCTDTSKRQNIHVVV